MSITSTQTSRTRHLVPHALPLRLCLATALAGSLQAQVQVSFEDEIIFQAPSGSRVGDSIDSGDVNGDGHVDLAVVDSTYQLAGRGWILLGPDFQTVIDVDLNEPEAFDYLGSRHGSWLLSDVTGDGLDDLLVSSRESYAGTATRAVGKALVVPGPDFQNPIELQHPDPDYVFITIGMGFGSSMLAHDYDEDGVRELLVGAYNVEGPGGENYAGSIFVYAGNQLSAPPIDVIRPPSPFSWDRWGTPLLKADFDHDGTPDLLTGESYTHPEFGEPYAERGMAWILGFDFDDLVTWVPGISMLTFDMNATLTDLDHDGHLDYLAAAYSPEAQEEIRWSYGPDHLSSGKINEPNYDTGDTKFGDGIAVGDFNRDGIRDIAVGGPELNDDNGEINFGRVYLYLGPDYKEDQYFQGEHKHARLGVGLHALDLNGDGFDELVAGAGSENGGRIHLYRHHTLRLVGADSVSVTSGGTVDLSIEVGPLSGDQPYLLVLSAAGSEPGVDFGAQGGGSVHVPLEPDDLTFAALALYGTPVFQGFVGVTDSGGNAQASLTVSPGTAAGLAGGELTAAAIVLDPTLGVTYATGAVQLQVLP